MSGRNEKASEECLEKKASAPSTEELPSGSRVRKQNAAPSEIKAKMPKMTEVISENTVAMEQEDNEESEIASLSNTSILALNEYCWFAIFSYLSLRGQLKLAASNRMISKIYQGYIRRTYICIDEHVTTNIDHSDLAHLLELMREDVISYESPLDPVYDGEQHLWLLEAHSKELQHLKMTFRRPRWENLLGLQKLTSLHAHMHFGNAKICTNFVINLAKLPCLRKLKLEAIDYKGEGLHMLENLESLEIGARPGFDANYLVLCCQMMKRLRHLHIGKYIDNLTAENFRVIVRNCRNLERFIFGTHLLESNVPYEIICELPKLKHLQLWHTKSIRIHFIERLINKPGDPLESLVLIGYDLEREQVDHLCNISSLRELHVACKDVPLSGLLMLTNVEFLHIDMPDIKSVQLMQLLMGCQLLKVLSVPSCKNIDLNFVCIATQFWMKNRSEKINIYLNDSSVDWRFVQMYSNTRLIQFLWGSLRYPILINEELTYG